jgi:hypothetical protein
VTVIEQISTKFDDPRIGNLPKWAQEIIEHGRSAERSANYWNRQHEEACAELDRVRADHAREHGAAEYDTWVVETGTDAYSDTEIRFGLGTGRAVEFGDSSDICPMYTVIYKDGGLNITTQGSGFALKLPRFSNDTLRVDAD